MSFNYPSVRWKKHNFFVRVNWIVSVQTKFFQSLTLIQFICFLTKFNEKNDREKGKKRKRGKEEKINRENQTCNTLIKVTCLVASCTFLSNNPSNFSCPAKPLISEPILLEIQPDHFWEDSLQHICDNKRNAREIFWGKLATCRLCLTNFCSI